MPVSVIVPYRPDGGYRDQAWEWIRQRWAAMFPDYEVVVGSDDGGANPGEFNHGLAVNRAAERASGDVLLIADADVAPDPWLLEAVARVAAGDVRWALPSRYRKLTREATDTALGWSADADLCKLDVEWDGSVSVASIQVVPREGFDLVGGFDSRFDGWGADDVCFAIAMHTLWGAVTRVAGAVHHLWHPAPIAETYGHRWHPRQDAIMREYIAAGEAADPDVIRKLRGL